MKPDFERLKADPVGGELGINKTKFCSNERQKQGVFGWLFM